MFYALVFIQISIYRDVTYAKVPMMCREFFRDIIASTIKKPAGMAGFFMVL